MRRSHAVTVEIAESVSEGDYYVAPEGVVDGLDVSVARIGYCQILGLSEQVVALDGNGCLIVQNQLL